MTTDYRHFPILYVDDDKANLLSLCYALEDEFWLVTASTGEEALRKLVDEDIAVLLADQRMPGMTGSEVCARARVIKPNVVRIIVTAYADLKAATEAINLGQVTQYVTKPWKEEDLRAILRTGIEVFHLQRLVGEMEIKLMRNERASGALAVTDVLEHEIRQRLAALQLALELLSAIAQGVTDGQLQGKLQEIAKNGKTSIEHVTSLLNRVRADAITRLGEPVDADAARVIEMAMGMSRAELSRRAQCDVIVEGRPRVAIAPTELAQVLLNLLTNAHQALPEGEAHKNRISVHLRVVGDRASFTVSDTGPGIPPENLELIFERHFTTKGEGKGTGLGLTIVKGILERRDGEITVESPPGKGTTFHVKIPLVVEPAGGESSYTRGSSAA